MNDELPGRYVPLSLVSTLEKIFSRETACVLAAHGHWEKFKYKALIQEVGADAESILFILSGGVKLTKIGSERKAILDIVGPMEIVGGPLIMSENITQQFPVQIDSLAATEVLFIEKKTYHSILKFRDDFSVFLSQQINQRIQRLQAEVLLSQMSVKARVADFLINKLSRIPKIKMTRAEIAQAVGSTHESIIRILSHWEKQGIVHFEKQILTKISLSQLESVIHSSS